MALQTPPRFAKIEADGWVNIHRIIRPPRLSGVDAYLGDLNAHTLILGQDFGPASFIQDALNRGDSDPYRHAPDLATNRLLAELLAEVGVDAPLRGQEADRCGLYYANAIYLLRAGSRFGGSVKFSRAVAVSRPVLSHILDSLLKLQRIIAMGAVAFRALVDLFDVKADWRSALETRTPIRVDQYELWASSHLSPLGVKNRRRGAPIHVCRALITNDWRSAFGREPNDREAPN